MTIQQLLQQTAESRQYLRFIEDHAVSGVVINLLNIIEELLRILENNHQEEGENV